MCGIAGYFGTKEILKNSRLALKLMKKRSRCTKLQSNKNKKKNLYLLHSRLSIIDLHERSNQPFETERSILYLMEKFIIIRTKENLQGKYNFKTNSDTEVVLACYEIYGEKCFFFLMVCGVL